MCIVKQVSLKNKMSKFCKYCCVGALKHCSGVRYIELFPKYCPFNKCLIFVTQRMLLFLENILLSFHIEKIYCRDLEYRKKTKIDPNPTS